MDNNFDQLFNSIKDILDKHNINLEDVNINDNIITLKAIRIDLNKFINYISSKIPKDSLFLKIPINNYFIKNILFPFIYYIIIIFFTFLKYIKKDFIKIFK